MRRQFIMCHIAIRRADFIDTPLRPHARHSHGAGGRAPVTTLVQRQRCEPARAAHRLAALRGIIERSLHDDRAFIAMVAVAHGFEPKPCVKGFGGDRRRDRQGRDVSLARRALDLGHQCLAYAPVLRIGRHEDGADHAAVKARRSDHAAAIGRDEYDALFSRGDRARRAGCI